MAKALSKTGIVDGQLATAAQVTQSIDAFTAASDYDIEISGSLGVTGPLSVTGSTDLDGNLAIPGFPNVSASLAASGVGNGFPFTGSAAILGSLSIDGPNGTITSSGAISASGDIIGANLYAQGGLIYTGNTQSLRNASNGLLVGAAPQWEQVTLGRVGTPTIINGAITASSNISASGNIFGETGSFSHLEGNSPITVGDSITFQQPITASSDMTSSANIYAGTTNISNPRGDGFMGGGDSGTDLVFLTHQDFHLVDLGTAGSPLDNMAAQRNITTTSNTQVNGGATDHRFASYIIPCGYKVSKVGVLGNGGTFNVRATSVASGGTQDCFAEGAAQSVTTTAPADTFAGYSGMATELGGEAAIVPSASLSGGLGNYINIDVIGNNTIYGGVIVLDRI